MLKNITTSKYYFLFPILITSFFFFIFYSSFSIHKHQTFNSYAFDLGTYTHDIYLLGHSSLLPFDSIGHLSIFATHFEPILYIFALPGLIFPISETLLVTQAVFVSLSSIFIYLISLKETKNSKLSLIISISYLSSPGLISAINFDFHPSTLSVLPLSMILYFLTIRKWKLYWVVLFITLLFKEDVVVFILGLGIYLVIKKEWRIGVLTCLVSFCYYLATKVLLMPLIWPNMANYYVKDSIIPLSNPIAALYLIIQKPDLLVKIFSDNQTKLFNLQLLYQHFAYLPLFSSLSLLTVLPYLLLRYSNYSYFSIWSPFWHHNANLEPFLAVSTILFIKRLKISKYFIQLFLILFLLTNLTIYYQKIWLPLRTKDNNLTNYDYVNKALATLPSKAPLSAGSALGPHLANRENIYLFPDIYDSQYIILDSRLDPYPLKQTELQQKIIALKSSKTWKIFFKDQSLIIFKKVE